MNSAPPDPDLRGGPEDASQDVSQDHFMAVMRATVEEFPDPFRGHARQVRLCLAELPDPEEARDLGLASPMELTGLYDGIPMTEKSVWDMAERPDTVWLYREPILAEWRDRGDVTLDQLIAHVVVHEFAHHFGWSDDDIAEIDPWWE
ncbi:MAG: metallopeptidase family protein [Pseudooceanicola atlanticus]